MESTFFTLSRSVENNKVKNAKYFFIDLTFGFISDIISSFYSMK